MPPSIPWALPSPNQQRPNQNVPDAGDPMDLSASRLKRSGPVSQDERNRRQTLGLCYYCGEAGHKSLVCPKKASRPSLVGRSVELLDEELTAESGKVPAP